MTEDTAYCPKSHELLSWESAGKEYGHIPGHYYRDVDVCVSQRSNRYRTHICESWGSAQGYDEEHGRRQAIGQGESIRESVRDARQRASLAGITPGYLEDALSRAEDSAEDAAQDKANLLID